MKLVTVQVKNFRCIEDTTPFSLGQVTCLVGKNESGKTAILQALARLNPFDANRQSYDKLRDYPRRYLAEYAARHPDGEAEILVTQWALELEDQRVLGDEFGLACVTGPAV